MQKPELLVPVGNVESFYAALKGGANAVYLGTKHFNARERAANFSLTQLLQIIDEAQKNHVKVYITLNTVIKNHELDELLDILWFLSKTKVSAIIVQDWGTFYLTRRFFPHLTIHASTQMANHNSAGTGFSKKMGFARVILSRELTGSELEAIQENTPIETEIFVHGALCYSFSGMCLFSSYLGGAGANRGLCAQPCRRFYKNDHSERLLFSMKDNQQIQMVPKLMEMGIASLKIEGRLKSAEYVHHVTRAYRMVIDDLSKMDEAFHLLESDLGREKTQWFMAKQHQTPLTTYAGTGKPIGRVVAVQKNQATIWSPDPLKAGNRIRIRAQDDSEPVTITLNHFVKTDENSYVIATDNTSLKPGDEVTLISTGDNRFPSKLKGDAPKLIPPIPQNLKSEIFSKIKSPRGIGKETLFLRINNLEWLPMISFEYINHLIIQLTKTEFAHFDFSLPILNEDASKIWIELPRFIPEKDIDFYKEILAGFSKHGLNHFSISHLSQKELLPEGAVFGTNENVYCYNDAAANLIIGEKATWITSPFENDMENLFAGNCRNILIPMFYYPRLFYSRQPVKLENNNFSDDKNKYRVFIRNGMTVVVPQIPVSLLQYKTKLTQQGFHQFLLDLSFEEPSKNTLKKVVTKLKRSEAAQPSTTFNFKLGMR
ncbi:MAG TPA: hypothetical protein DCQ26_04080 [Marinilabiliales bacterium]|nr:MAG: hypothetical protein A2W95_03360 [Bacteroidetes bacterium GWA2_40_14]OFX58101.1 MAG: hypothetical protein A2W84_09035 [Bacteroidetes bacterium GWC2_40_13]OFX72739.1 MAG: hypothetical protein A2W96_18545 [Bacteroidetes bacterium GWD2_40_43]OFX91369.1 MAG: hypothetical protein A2W97_03965 [Bacteroidetes bacterium GWE2_40_63]OFY19438.1 MAG: hypothetical protein A2W88_01845 [Bacteroidetes bacterium GWF2_40_13]OFZ25588.1 MAG: hypothetical protein A2437_12250 [Bacteroidetes bacterium RIFOXYC